MTFKLSVLASLAGLMTLAACGGGGAAPQASTWEPFVYVGPTVVTKTDIVVGTGAEAVPGKTATVLLTRWNYSATAPDFKYGSAWPAQLPPPAMEILLNVNAAAPDTADAIVGMRVGGKRSAIIPGDMTPDTRTGASIGGGVAPVPPPRAPVVAEIELLDVK